MHRKVAAALVAALALGIVGCGGSEKTLTGAALARQVEVACREGRTEAAQQVRAARGRSGGYIAAVLAGEKSVMDGVDDVNTSGAAKADLASFKDGVQRSIDSIERVVSAGGSGQQRALTSVQAQVQAASRQMRDAARSLGVRTCI